MGEILREWFGFKELVLFLKQLETIERLVGNISVNKNDDDRSDKKLRIIDTYAPGTTSKCWVCYEHWWEGLTYITSFQYSNNI
jgi:hypothetical protein